MTLSDDYIKDLLVRMTHHSSAIENNTITLNETISILLYDTIPNKISVREFHEVENHKYAFEFLLQKMTQKEPLSLSILHQTHALLLDRLHHERGRFKTEGNAIVGADFRTATVEQTPLLMKQWVENVRYRNDHATSKDDQIKLACESHIDFERIHPYADGNGRTGRLIMNYLLLTADIAPLIIDKKDKASYVQFLANQDTSSFVAYAREKIQQEEERIRSFHPKMNKNNPENKGL